jgi:hypothetical protein
MKRRVDFQIAAVDFSAEEWKGAVNVWMTGRYAVYKRYDHMTFSAAMIDNVHDAFRVVISVIDVIKTWKRTFPLFPVRLEEGGWTWMRPVWTRVVDRSQPYCSIFRRQYTRDHTRNYY